MREYPSMALLITDPDRPSPKVWQPWYMEESEGIRKELPSRAHREQRMRERMMTLHRVSHRETASPGATSGGEEIDVVGASPSPYSHPPGCYVLAPFDEDEAPLDMSTKRRSPPSPPPAHTPTVTHTPPPSLPPPAHAPTHTPPPPPPRLAHTPTPSLSPPPPYPGRMVYQAPSSSRGRPTVICAAPRYPPIYTHPHSDAHPPSPVDHPPHVAHHQRLPTLPPAYAQHLPTNNHPPPPPPPYSVAAAHLRKQYHLQESLLTTVSDAAIRVHPLASAHSSPSPSSPIRGVSPPGGVVAPPSPLGATSGGSGDDGFPKRRQVVQAGTVDPEIDEHFRRSLGKNYHQLFIDTSKQDDSNDSVDDHFAKALGDTWKKLKGRERETSTPSSSPSPVPTSHPQQSSSYTHALTPSVTITPSSRSPTPLTAHNSNVVTVTRVTAASVTPTTSSARSSHPPNLIPA